MEGVTDVDELNQVLDRTIGLRTFLTADDRIEKVAAFVAKHFRENVAPLHYKAFLVGVNREACAKYKRALDKLLPPEWTTPVYTENAADIVNRPLVAEYQLSPDREADTRLMFKKADANPKIPHRHRQTTHRLRRAAPLLPVSRQAHARPRAPASHRAREPPLRHK